MHMLSMCMYTFQFCLHSGVSITAGEHDDDFAFSCGCIVGLMLGCGEGATEVDGCRKLVVSLVHTDEVTGVVISVDHGK